VEFKVSKLDQIYQTGKMAAKKVDLKSMFCPRPVRRPPPLTNTSQGTMKN